MIVLALLLVALDKNIDEEIQTSGPVWKEMKSIVRKGKKLVFKRNADKYENV